MQELKNKWKQIIVITVIVLVCTIYIREKFFYKSLFSEPFCESIVEIQYIDYRNEVYTITNEAIVDEFMKVLSENRYRRVPGTGSEGVTAFKLISDEKEYRVCMDGEEVEWKRKLYKPKEGETIDELRKKVWKYWGIE